MAKPNRQGIPLCLEHLIFYAKIIHQKHGVMQVCRIFKQSLDILTIIL